MYCVTEKVKQKDELIQQTMEEKKKLVAELLDVPLQDYDTIVDVSVGFDLFHINFQDS